MVISAPAAKQLANAHLSAEGSPWVAARASRDKEHGLWVVDYQDPAHPGELLVGGALAVTDEGQVHNIGSTSDAVDRLAESLDRAHAGVADERRDREGGSARGFFDQVPRPRAFFGPLPWEAELGAEFEKAYFVELMDFVDGERSRSAVYPAAEYVFAAFRLTTYEKVKVVILGQDPYHQPGQANGLCFSVPRELSALPPSLRNIKKSLAHDGYSPPAHGDLTGWARQGVLLLNTALSVPESAANSHAKEWRQFTDAVIRRLSDRKHAVVFVLWGRPAERRRPLIDEPPHLVVTAPHPASRGRHQIDFRTAGTFIEVNRHLKELQVDPIDWSAT